jgi:hypothetical protein
MGLHETLLLPLLFLVLLLLLLNTNIDLVAKQSESDPFYSTGTLVYH